ncbi:hypothetical protein OUO20_13400 [Arthrobacter sp. FX8]|uniref:hypothetical protein n=1 Tax=unclassified Arthrobacter TaxID=235627 RepID=UPI00036367A2|nr:MULTISPECIES: hypothetical protein [unclassified Arthrobacter]WAJ35425.1 hypothetical protein OUO20_13400 [Arthrobacter sp. FX8]BCW55894.1 hypothetical protein StoSoilB19_32680 [Arthrobacter sp. StoSoilB19]BCW76992.1 hypothetical protein NicSoilB11_33170 [Arthrobacter sp. NicSoilB11]
MDDAIGAQFHGALATVDRYGLHDAASLQWAVAEPLYLAPRMDSQARATPRTTGLPSDGLD